MSLHHTEDIVAVFAAFSFVYFADGFIGFLEKPAYFADGFFG